MAAPSKRSGPASSPAPVALAVTAVQVDPAIQPRAYLTPHVIAEYAVLYTEAEDSTAVLPPLEVFQVEGTYYVVDGFHRLAAAKEAQREAVLCRVYPGTRQDAIRQAALANLKRGLPYSSDDRTRVLERLLADPEMGQRSDRQLGAELGLSHMTVYRARQRLAHIATLTQELTAQPTTAKAPAAQQQEQLATFLAVPVAQVALLAKRGRADRTAVVRKIARTMADCGRSAEEAKREEAENLVYWAERQAREDAGKYGAPRRRETAEERRQRQATAQVEDRYAALKNFLETFADFIPVPPTPEEAADGAEPYTPDASPADLIAAVEDYLVLKYRAEAPADPSHWSRAEARDWFREEIVTGLQQAYHVLDAFKDACVAQGWTVPS